MADAEKSFREGAKLSRGEGNPRPEKKVVYMNAGFEGRANDSDGASADTNGL